MATLARKYSYTWFQVEIPLKSEGGRSMAVSSCVNYLSLFLRNLSFKFPENPFLAEMIFNEITTFRQKRKIS